MEQVILPTFIECSCEFALLMESSDDSSGKEKKTGDGYMAFCGGDTHGFPHIFPSPGITTLPHLDGTVSRGHPVAKHPDKRGSAGTTV